VKRNITGLKLAVLTIAFAWLSAVHAQDVQLRADHPQDYVVVKGDTLWDISGRFLEHPWQWPAIWQANPQIEDPHWIYPGDKISLIYVDGQPRLVINRLEPEIREVSGEPIDAIPFDLVDNFLVKPRVITAAEFESLPYLIANSEQRLNAMRGDHTYARGITGELGTEYMVAELSYIYQEKTGRHGTKTIKHKAGTIGHERVPKRDTGFRRESKDMMVLGYEMYEVARVKVIKSGDPAILEVLSGKREVKPGDYLLPIDTHTYDRYFHPHVIDVIPDNLRILTLSDDMLRAGHYRVVALSAGDSDGMESGHVFSIFRPGRVVNDDVKFTKGSANSGWGSSKGAVQLPDEKVGMLLVFRTFENLSYGLVLGGNREVAAGDLLKHPDTQL